MRRLPAHREWAFCSLGTSTQSVKGFVAAMERLGYREGATVAYELRSSGVDQLSRVVGDLVALRPDIVVSWTSTAARALASATEDIPVVMGVVGDPVALGLTTSFAHPTRNVTGFTTLNDTLGAKRLELLREIMPSASRIALLWVPTIRSRSFSSGRPRRLLRS